MTRPSVVFCNEVSEADRIRSEEAKEAPPTTTVEGLWSVGSQHQTAGRFDAAIEKYKTALALAQERHDTLGIATSFAFLGIGYSALGRWQEAMEANEQGISLKPDLVEAHFGLGFDYGQLGRWQEAVEAYRQTLRLKPDYAEVYANLAFAYGQLGRWQEAAEANKQAIQLKPDLAEAHFGLGLAYGQLGQWQEAAEAYKQAIQFKASYAEAHFSLGFAYEQLGQWSAAVEPLKQAIQLKPDNTLTYYNLGFAYGQLRRWPEAVEAYKYAIQLKPFYLEAHQNLGLAYGQLGRWQEAVEANKQVLAIAKEQKNVSAEATAFMGLAWASGILGDVDNDQKYLLEAKALYESMENLQQEAMILAEIGRFYLDMSRYDEALNFFHQALNAYREAKDPKGQRELLAQIGDVYGFWLADAQAAMPWYQDALEIAKAIDYAPGELQTLAMLLSIDALLGNQMVMDQHGSRAAKIAEEIIQQISHINRESLAPQEGQTLAEKFLAVARFNQIVGSLYPSDLAITLLNGALNVHQAFGKTREFLKETAIDFYYLGFTQSRLEHYDEALKALHQAEESAKRLSSPEIFRIFAGIGWIREQQGQLQEALSSYIQATEVLERVSFQQRSQEVKIPLRELGFNVYSNIVRLLYKLHQQDPQQHYLEKAFFYYEKGKARSLLDLLAEAKVHIQEGIDPGLLKKEEQISTRISRLHRVLVEPTLTKEQEKPLLATLAEQEQALQALQALQVQMAVANPKYAALTSPQTADIPQVQAILDSDTLLLEYIVTEEKSFLWAITQEGMHSYELPKQEDLDRQVEQYLSTLKTPLFGKDEIEQHIALGKELYRTLLQPAASQLKGKSKVIIVPDGSLYSLPFEALIMEDGNEYHADRETLHLLPYFIKNYTVTYTPSASVLVALGKNHDTHLAKDSSQSPLLAFGDPPPLPDGFERLPHAAEEVQNIAGIFGVPLSSDAVSLQERAAKKYLREMDLSRYHVLHFATHAILADQVKRITQPSLVLSLAGTESPQDSFLQMGEIFNLRLNADLVVLSACDTGKGKLYRGEGIVGLTRAFMYAGTPSLVASLWKVSDRSTGQLMEFFYRHVKEGQSKAEALQQAKRELIEAPVWNE